MNLTYVILYVNDVEKSIDFYIKAFGLKHKFTHESGDYAEMETGSTTLGFSSKNLIKNILQLDCKFSSKEEKPLGSQITFTPEDVKMAYKSAVEKGAISVKEPVVMPWNFEVAMVRDIDGHLIELALDLNQRA